MNGMSFQALVQQARSSGELDVEGAKLDFAIALARQLERAGLSKAEFAKRFGVSKPLVTRILRGDSNLTIETMVRAALAAGARLHLHVAPAEQEVRWFQLCRTAPVPGAQAAHRRADAPALNPWHIAANEHLECHESQPNAA